MTQTDGTGDSDGTAKILLKGFSKELTETITALANDTREIEFHPRQKAGIHYDVALIDANDPTLETGTIGAMIADPDLQSLRRTLHTDQDEVRAARQNLLEQTGKRIVALAQALASHRGQEKAVANSRGAQPGQTLETILAGAVAKARGEQMQLGFALISIDNIINLINANNAQAQCMQVAEQIIKNMLRLHDVVVRTETRQFAIVIHGPSANSHVVNIVTRVLESLRKPVYIEGERLQMLASIGYSEYPLGSQDANSLLQHASIALTRARERGGNCFDSFDVTMGERLSKRWALEDRLQKALNRQEFSLDYHPIVDASSLHLAGVEALLRWDDPERGRIYPDQFIPVLEDTAMIIPVGEWVLYEACRQIQKWRSDNARALMVSVNVSPKQLDDPEFLRKLSRILTLTNINREDLCLEITENVLVGNDPEMLATLDGIAKLGVNLFIDDFGTGFSSLSYLKRLPLRGFKVDRSFVDDVPNDSNNTAITLSVLDLGRNMDLLVIPEGIETVAQMNFVIEHGADFLQGFYFSKPLPPKAIAELLQADCALPLGSAPSSPLTPGTYPRDH